MGRSGQTLSVWRGRKEYDRAVDCNSRQIINAQGKLNDARLRSVIKAAKLVDAQLSYAVISIMGPQSSGKSTLLNELYGTNFKEMDSHGRRQQTTNGVWLAKAIGVKPLTLVMDLEGNDGRERGEADTTFEKQIALLALSISDILIINMWFKDVGREQAANKPLLRIIFQEYMTKVRSTSRKITLIFVLRDKEETPMGEMESTIREDIMAIWHEIPKRAEYNATPFDEIFDVIYVALSHRRLQKEDFMKEMIGLRQSIHSIISEEHTRDIPGSGFCCSCQQLWKSIKDNENLDLPEQKVLVANAKCEEFANDTFSKFKESMEWKKWDKMMRSGSTRDCGERFSAMLNSCLESYEKQALYYPQDIKSEKKKQLSEKIMKLAEPTFQSNWGTLRRTTQISLEKKLDEALYVVETFASTAIACTKSHLLDYDRKCADLTIEETKSNILDERKKFLIKMRDYVRKIGEAKHGAMQKDLDNVVFKSLETAGGIMSGAGSAAGIAVGGAAGAAVLTGTAAVATGGVLGGVAIVGGVIVSGMELWRRKLQSNMSSISKGIEDYDEFVQQLIDEQTKQD